MSGDKDGVFEVAILGRVTWQLHSLNNEGTVGNVTEPRSLKIIDPETKKIVTSDGISGEMLKHIHAEMVWRLENDKNNFCDACRSLEPSRFDYKIQKAYAEFKNANKNKVKKLEETHKTQALQKYLNNLTYEISSIVERAITTCEMCDLHGFLIQDPAGNRPSLIEFGWAVALPGTYERDIHTHARHAPGEKGRGAEVEQQMVYHRPTRTGIYAVISVFQAWKIGLNNVTREYIEWKKNSKDDNTDNVRKHRYELALKAYRAMFLQTEGAMSTTRLPHLLDFEGVIVYSTTNIPVPKISPLKKDYRTEIKKIAQQIDKNNIEVKKFDSPSEFAEIISGLLKKQPYKFSIGEQK